MVHSHQYMNTYGDLNKGISEDRLCIVSPKVKEMGVFLLLFPNIWTQKQVGVLLKSWLSPP